jgi:hypothetical protein
VQACEYLSGQSRLRPIISVAVQRIGDRLLPHNALSSFTHLPAVPSPIAYLFRNESDIRDLTKSQTAEMRPLSAKCNRVNARSPERAALVYN